MGDFDAADGGYGSTQCWDHPYRATNSGGVCALCVQERLCKLIVSCSSESSLPLSSSFPSASSSSSSSTPSFHSRLSSSTSSSAHIASLRSRMSFLYYHMSKEKKKKKTEAILRRTNSVAPSVVLHPMDSPRRRWFWPFSVTHEKVGHGGAVRWNCREKVEENNVASLNKRSAVVVQVDKQHLESTQTSERKVTRSRSVGCGNRSFSRGGFLERISTGSADCTYRRTESQRQGNYKDGSSRTILQQSSASSIVQQSDSMSTPFPSTHPPPPPLVTLLWVPDKKADGVDTRLPAIKAKSKEDGKGRRWAAAFATPMTSIRSYVAAYPSTPNRRRLFAKK